jgi:hypothetical protein
MDVIKMNNIKINAEDYIEYGLGDIYYSLLTFISRYAAENYDPMEYIKNGTSKYAITVTTMKDGLKEILDYLKTTTEVYLPALNKNVQLNTLTIEEQLALEERCKEYLILKLEGALNITKKETPKVK